ncbi:hypothetical protein IMSAGC019_01763 [Lachnospiraceae bacterium]|nr:hypothetical protein IMSAGC019_01763 [Lachnospiraceae bacterium]
MEQLLEWMEIIEDIRQHRKVRHNIKDILIIVLFATLANADTWEQIADFALWNEGYPRQYIELKNGVPPHGTIQRVMGMIRPENLQQLQLKWQEMLGSGEGGKLKKIICVDGKTMRSNKRKGTKPCHIVSAWSREDGYCLGQQAVDEKSNEITAIPKVLESIGIKGQVVTIDAMGTQTAIVETIRKRRADYVLAVKGNQGNLETDIRLYFEDPKVCEDLKKGTGYKKSVEKAHGQTEIREYYQTGDVGWMQQRGKWKGLKSIGMEKKTIRKGEEGKEEYRYYISSLGEDIGLFSRAVRGHWPVESMHWHLDVTFKEDANTTLDKTAAQNQNIIRKWCLGMLKMIEIRGGKMSLRRKRFNISFAPAQFIEELMKI